MLAQRDLDLHARVEFAAQHLDDAPDRLGGLRRWLGDFHGDDIASACPTDRIRLDQDVLRNAPIGGHQISHTVLTMQLAHHPGLRPLQDLNNRTLWSAPSISARGPHQHTVTVKDLVHLARREKQIVALVIDHETETIGVGLDAATDQVGLLGNEDRTLAIDDDLTVAHHR